MRLSLLIEGALWERGVFVVGAGLKWNNATRAAVGIWTITIYNSNSLANSRCSIISSSTCWRVLGVSGLCFSRLASFFYRISFRFFFWRSHRNFPCCIAVLVACLFKVLPEANSWRFWRWNLNFFSSSWVTTMAVARAFTLKKNYKSKDRYIAVSKSRNAFNECI